MMRRLWPFVVGSVALGLDAYVVAGLLPSVASSLGAREATVGLGVAAFTGSYAVAGPLLAGRAGQRSRRSLITALLVFTAANLATALSPTVGVFLGARVVAGAAASVYSPLSSAVAAKLVGQERRGRAVALVLAGLAVGTVFGVPIGLALAQRWGWRAAILLIVAIGGAALAGIALRGGELPAIPASSPADRLRSIARPKNLLTVTVTLLTGVASLGLYTYLTVVLSAGSLASHQSMAIWFWGLGGAVGALGIGPLVDRFDPLRLSAVILTGLVCALFGMTQVHAAGSRWQVCSSGGCVAGRPSRPSSMSCYRRTRLTAPRLWLRMLRPTIWARRWVPPSARCWSLHTRRRLCCVVPPRQWPRSRCYARLFDSARAPRRRRASQRRPYAATPTGRRTLGRQGGLADQPKSKWHDPLMGKAYVHIVIDDHSRVA